MELMEAAIYSVCLKCRIQLPNDLVRQHADQCLPRLLQPGASVYFECRMWLDKANGNPYHSVRVWVNGEPKMKLGMCYGGERAYQRTAIQWLVAAGYLPELSGHGLLTRETADLPDWKLGEFYQIAVYYSQVWGLKKDLFIG